MAVKDEEIIFRASNSGSLMMDKKGAVLTPRQAKELATYEFREEQAKLDPKKALTAKMRQEMEYYQKKRDAPYELSGTAKEMVEQLWRQQEKGIPHLVTSKYMEKGHWAEEDGITLLTEVDGIFYKKNTERRINKMFTGMCDINKKIKGSKVIQDVKSSWDAVTFMKMTMSTLEEWQGRIYMKLYGADEFWLRRCLVDCPEHIWEGERYRFCINNNIIDDEAPENKALIEEFRKTLFFSENPLITPQERVKTIKVERDDELFKTIEERVPAARAYYKSITLNQIVEQND